LHDLGWPDKSSPGDVLAEQPLMCKLFAFHQAFVMTTFKPVQR
jgi:hypothetical protein